MSYTNSPSKYNTTLKLKLLPHFVTNDKGQVTERSSSPEELASSSSSSASPSSIEAFGEGEGEGSNSLMHAYQHAMRPIECSSDTSHQRDSQEEHPSATTASWWHQERPAAEEEGAEEDRAKDGGVARVVGSVVSTCGRFGRNWASLHQIGPTLMALMTVK